MKLSDIKGLGPANLKKLKAAGIETPEDLILHFPHKYIDVTKAGRFDLSNDGDDFAAFGKVTGMQNKRIRKGLSYIKAEFITPANDKFTATWFNQPYISKIIKTHESYYILGKLKIFKTRYEKRYEISAPVIQPLTASARKIIPVYKGMGISKIIFENAVSEILKITCFEGILPQNLRQKFNLLDVNQVFNSLHFPQTLEETASARRSFSLENLSAHIAVFSIAKRKNFTKKPFIYDKNKGVEAVKQLINRLPFALTADQKAAAKRILELMDGHEPANALLEGDVGCGKTIVCFLAFAYAAASGHQCALMAPTEILARQHYSSAIKFFGAESVEYVTGSQTAAARAASRFNIENGVAKIVIGTHSLFSQDIKFQNLTLVVTDEQHRFGVNQRGALENKASQPDCIVMSATPIPRTLALTLYGDLQLISIRQKPALKAKIYTRFVGTKIKEMYEYITAKAVKGEQTYIVCTRIDDDGDDDDGNGKESLTNAKELFAELKNSPLKDTVALLHGQMKDVEKTAAMDLFIKGEKRVLVCTTIVEVGIDVPAATTMVIYNAERYGLSQLHQLRGRIGRGNIDSYCFLLCSPDAYDTRLKVLEECDDGFLLAEKDFEIRGAGDFLGVRQHGKSLTLTGEPITLELLTKAKEIAFEFAAEFAYQIENISDGKLLYFKELTLN